jgi:amidase
MQLLKDANFRAPMDTYLAQRFREAGFVTVGKTNTPELGILPTTEPEAYGATRNPWNPDHSAGGSSGGSGAAVASGMVPVAHANDGGGSIRIPAAQNGLVGLKPTRQRITEGPLAGDNLSGLTAELVVSKSVRDTAAILEAVHGPAPGDPYFAPPPARLYTEELDVDPKGLRIGFTTAAAVDVDIDPACVEAVEKTATLLESLGHKVSQGSPTDAAMAAGGGIDIEDSFLTRWAAGQAQILGTLGMAIGREITKDDVEPLTWALAEIGQERSAGRYLQDVGIHHVISRMIAGWYDSGFDLLMTPTTARPA